MGHGLSDGTHARRSESEGARYLEARSHRSADACEGGDLSRCSGSPGSSSEITAGEVCQGQAPVRGLWIARGRESRCVRKKGEQAGGAQPELSQLEKNQEKFDSSWESNTCSQFLGPAR